MLFILSPSLSSFYLLIKIFKLSSSMARSATYSMLLEDMSITIEGKVMHAPSP
jgi:hypothetical protein